MYKFLSEIPNPYILDYSGMLPGCAAYVTVDGKQLVTISGMGASGSGYWKFYGLTDHLKKYMQLNDLMVSAVRIEIRVVPDAAPTQVDEFDVVYCERKVQGIAPSDFLARRFFRSDDVAFLAEGVTQPLPFIMPIPATFWQERVWHYVDANGATKQQTSRSLMGERGTLTLSAPSDIPFQDLKYGKLSVFEANMNVLQEELPSTTYEKPRLLLQTRSGIKMYNAQDSFYARIRIDIPAIVPDKYAISLAVKPQTILVYADGELVASKARSTSEDLMLSVDLNGASMVAVMLEHSFKVTLPPVRITLTSAKVSEVSREKGLSLTVIPVSGPKLTHWRFRNIFNALEVISLPASVESKPETEAEKVICEGITTMYDQRTTVPHEVKFGVLQKDMIQPLRQMAQSWHVEYRLNGVWVPVVITKYEINDSTEVGSYIEPSLTFEFAEGEGYAELGSINPSSMLDDYTNVSGSGSGTGTGGGTDPGTGGGTDPGTGGGTVTPGDDTPEDFQPGQLVGTLQVKATQAEYDYDNFSSAVLGTPSSKPVDSWMRLTTNRIYCLKDSDVDFQMTVDAHCVVPSAPDYPIGSLCGVVLCAADGGWLDSEESNSYPTVDEVYTFHKQWHVPAGCYIEVRLSGDFYVTLKQPISITLKQWACDGRYDD